MEQFKLSKLVIGIALLGLIAIIVSQRNNFSNVALQFYGSEPVQKVLSFMEGKSLFPGPLRIDGSGRLGDLTVAGVIEHTNKQRAAQSLSLLVENKKLNKVAELKMKDMFAKQYFEHESPEGRGPSDLADDVGYKYLIVGENLAEGDFASDEDLVQAWMDSPGHRANILHKNFMEIGVAVGKGQFEGRLVWMAVQSFGVPAKICPSPNPSSQSQIDTNNARIDDLSKQADAARNREDWDTYNSIVEQLNLAIANTKALVEQYNKQVDSYNNCLETHS